MIKLWIRHIIFELGINTFFYQILSNFQTPDDMRRDSQTILFESYTKGFTLSQVKTETHIYGNVKILNIELNSNIFLMEVETAYSINTGNTIPGYLKIVSFSSIKSIII